jgi:hypothetical protein
MSRLDQDVQREEGNLAIDAGAFLFKNAHSEHLALRALVQVIIQCHRKRTRHTHRRTERARSSALQRQPDLKPAHPANRIKLLAIPLKIRRISRNMSRCRQPLIPDRVPGTPDSRNMFAMAKHCIPLRRNPQAA